MGITATHRLLTRNELMGLVTIVLPVKTLWLTTR